VKRRMSRDRRRAGVRVVLGQRDEALLRALARFRVARTDDLTQLFFRGVRRDTAAARFRRLHDAGFIQARSSRLSEQNIYQLGPEGRSWAEKSGVAAGTSPASPAVHHLAIVRLWAKLAATLAADGALRLARFEPDFELRARFAGSGAAIIPDAAIEIVDRQGQAPGAEIALEVDLTTERPGALLRKLTAYDPSPYFRRSAEPYLVVVLVGAGDRRRSSVQSLMDRGWRGEGVVCAESEWPAVLLKHLAPPLATSPHGKGSANGASAHGDAIPPKQGEELSPGMDASHVLTPRRSHSEPAHGE
jgi:protein involved in plasmid replication-relaxation